MIKVRNAQVWFQTFNRGDTTLERKKGSGRPIALHMWVYYWDSIKDSVECLIFYYNKYVSYKLTKVSITRSSLYIVTE